MGNKIAKTTQVSATEYYLHDLPSSYNLVLMEVLERGRFLKSILCKHDEGLVLVKVYFKRGDSLDLTEYKRRLSDIKEIFKSVKDPHVWPFDRWQETDKAAYLLRQYFFSNLHERLSTRPFLSQIEKKWLAFQLLCAVAQSHNMGVCHGDIKCENVLVTSWNWLYLSDFASFKPTYIPDDDPSDFSFFFDTGGRRRCYLAPERFYEHGGESQVAPDAPLKSSMDIFSLGCVIAELFLEGQPLFELSQLLAYRRGQYDPSQYLEKIQDSEIQKMILHMIQLDPDLRKSCDSYLQEFALSIFPNYFSPFLLKFFSLLSPCDSDNRVKVTQKAFPMIYEQMMSDGCVEDVILESSTSLEPPNNELLQHTQGKKGTNLAPEAIPDHVQLVGEINALLKETERGNNIYSKDKKTHAKYDASNYSKLNPRQSSKKTLHYKRQYSRDCAIQHDNDAPVLRKLLKNDLHALSCNGYDSLMDTYEMPFFEARVSKPRCDGMVLIASLLCSCLRSVKQIQLRRACLILLKKCSLYIDDEDRLQHVLPYVIFMLTDPAAIVRCAALETLCDILPLVQDFPPSDVMIFPEYILPMLSMLPDDTEESVRICYASNIFKIALTAYRFFIHSQGLAGGGSVDKSVIEYKSQLLPAESSGKKHIHKSEGQLLQLRKSIAEIVQELVIGPKQTPNIRRALLNDIGYLCLFFGQQQCNDFLLPILPAFLNDRDEQLRAVFYEQIAFVCYFVGQTSIEEYLLPYIEPALSDDMEAVIVNALECLSMLCKSGLLRKSILLGLTEKIMPLLRYPIQWVRRSAVNLIAACCNSLGEVDSYVYISPFLHPLFHSQPASLTSEEALFSSLKPPITKSLFYQVLENARSSDMLERQRKIWYNSPTATNQWETVDHAKKSGNIKFISSSGRKESDAQISTYISNKKHAMSLSGSEDAIKLRSGTLIQNSSCIGDIKDPLSSDKLQFSGFISPHVHAGDGTISDGPIEGIPLYSFCMDKRIVGVSVGSESTLYRNPKGVAVSCMASMDSKEPFSLSGLGPQTIVSDSFFNINDDVREPEKSAEVSDIRESEQFSYATGKFQDIYDPLKESSSAIGDDDSEPIGLHPFARVPSVPDVGWKPRGVLVAHLQEHRSAVNDIAISNDDTFFVSASDDSTVKIWDTRKLEKDISFRSRLTYSLDGSRALCTAILPGTAQVLVGASDGLVHCFSVDYISRGLGNVIERYSGLADNKKRDIGEGAIPSLINCSISSNLFSHTVLFSTERCGIHLWDTRASSDAWQFNGIPEEGYISSLVMGHGGNWFVSGSSRGVLTLWDLRFLLPVNSWQYPIVCPVEKMCQLIPSSNSTSSARPIVYAAVGMNEVSLWDAESGCCHQVFRIAGSERETEKSNVPQHLIRSSSKQNLKSDAKQHGNSKYRIDDLKQPPTRLHGIRSLLPLPGGDLITGSTDLRIRYWNHSSPERNYCVCGPSMKEVGNELFYDKRSSSGVQIVQEMSKRPAASKLTQKALLSMAATDSAGCHRDAVLSLASVKLNQILLISSSRDGAIKVWK